MRRLQRRRCKRRRVEPRRSQTPQMPSRSQTRRLPEKLSLPAKNPVLEAHPWEAKVGLVPREVVTAAGEEVDGEQTLVRCRSPPCQKSILK